MINILLTSVGRRTYLIDYFQKALNGKGNLYISNSTSQTSAFLKTDKSVVTPLIYDPGYIDFLKNFCIEKKINAIISLYDIDLYILAKHKKIFEDIGVKILVSDEMVIECCNDKWKTQKFLRQCALKTVNTYIDLDDAMADVKTGNISFPLFVKPRWGMGSLSVYCANNEDELRVFFNKIKNDIFDSVLKYEANLDKENCVIIQEKMKGSEYGLDVINDLEGNFVNAIVKQKLAMRAGETDSAKVIENDILYNIGKTIAHKLKHIANLDIDIFFDGTEAYVLEMNARFGGGYPFSHLAGVDLPKAIVYWLSGQQPDEKILKATPEIIGYKDLSLVRG